MSAAAQASHPARVAGRRGGPPIAYVNARLIDPAAGIDVRGGVVVADGTIADRGAHLSRAEALGSSGIEVVDCTGAVLAPGLVDMRVQLREPGEEHRRASRRRLRRPRPAASRRW